MKFPQLDSRSHHILIAINDQLVTLEQGIELHGSFPSGSCPDGVPKKSIARLYFKLVNEGCMAKVGDQYRLTLAAGFRLQSATVPKTDGRPLVPPFRKNVWTTPMTGSYSASLKAKINR